MRIAAALQLKRGDIRGLDGNRPTFKPNREGEAQKGIEPLPRPIIHSQIWLRRYLNEYHPEDHPEAPVFAVHDYDTRERENTALHPTTVRNNLKDLGERAGIDRDRVYAHTFRHVAVTRMRRDLEMDWDDIAHRTDWSDRSLSHMKEVYAHLTNEEKNHRVFDAAGREPEEERDDLQPAEMSCFTCGLDLQPDWDTCPRCSTNQDAARASADDTETIPVDQIDEYMSAVLTGAFGQFEEEAGVDLELDDPERLLEEVKQQRRGSNSPTTQTPTSSRQIPPLDRELTRSRRQST